MQNKGVIKFFAILFALICVYQLSFTFFANRIDQKAEDYANAPVAKQIAEELGQGDKLRTNYYHDSIITVRNRYFIDSVGNEVVYNIGIRKYTYKECKARELNLGLDLRGGMNVLMEVSTSDVVRALSGYSNDVFFNSVMADAVQRHKVEANSNFVDIFATVWDEKDKNASMASVFSYAMKDINPHSTNTEVIRAIKNETNSAFDRTYQILRQRIDKFGVTQPNVQKLGQTERILVELPGVKDPERVRKLLQGTAQLEFWETYEFTEIIPAVQQANDYLVSAVRLEKQADTTKQIAVKDVTVSDSSTDDLLSRLAGTTDSSSQNNALDEAQFRENNPLFSIMMPSIYQGEDLNKRTGPVVGYSREKDIPEVNRLLELAKSKFPRNVKFVWSVKPVQPNTDIYTLIALKITTRDGRAPLGGDVITDARQDYQQNGGVEISMSMNTEGARIWKNLTGANIGKSVAIVMDNMAYSWPTVNNEISGGRSSITGVFSVEEGKDLANVLKAGKLPAPARIVQEAVVGPSLGQEAISSSLTSFLLAFLLILIYMFVFYNRAGLIANLALLVNIFFLFGVLTSLGAVLTLPGIAGIVLTLGMAVDANVLIFERIKEELRAGKGIRMAVDDGYKHAMSAIIDSNVTTLLVGIILLYFGTGPIQGFATTLSIGILTSLFTAIFISRLIMLAIFKRNKSISFSHKFSQNFLAKVRFPFIEKRFLNYTVSIVLTVAALASIFTRGFSYGIDFSGGRTYVVRFDNVVRTDEVRTYVAEALDGDEPEVKTFGPSNQVKITTKYKINETGDEVEQDISNRLYNGVTRFFREVPTYDEFSKAQDGKMLGVLSYEVVGPTVATDITRGAFIAVLISIIGIFLYIFIRFKRWQYGVSCAISLIHDTIVTMGVFSLFWGILPFSLDVDQHFIAAILTIIGWSVNDTVIIFDRIRENMHLYPKRSLMEKMNLGMNETLPRTVNTFGTTFVVVLAMFIFGGEVIRGFTFCIMIGIALGTYSSIFVAAPVAYDMSKKSEAKKISKA
ncbi:MAG: protein translocase subunit SecDF [Bacteroidales bacterium]|jgi:SecD/SecF fusion protein|nr:protein translocase subunit SecDF [Bacteroidales bacterium]